MTRVFALISLALGALLTTGAFIAVFFFVPIANGGELAQVANIGGEQVTHQLWFSQKIFYFHVPVAIASFAALALGAWHSIQYLRTKRPVCDLRARTAMEVGLIFIILTMISGDLWTRSDWNTWWNWDPRLTTYLILMLLVIAYFILRVQIESPERRARISAVFGIIAFANAALSMLIPRLMESMHPVVLSGSADSGLTPPMLAAFLTALFGMLFIGFGLYYLRSMQLELAERLALVQARYDEAQGS
ncbi:MAG: cytochrome c biogenesis protein CcsA [Coriobacteriia bacterium]|nr:cytochrome c biogenesis protein CcsA [Coriobacteriia bacterium]